MKALQGDMLGLEINTASKSPDVYLTIRVWPAFALYVKELRHPAFQRTIADVVLRAVQEAVLKEFGLSGGRVGEMVKNMTPQEALVELMRTPDRRALREPADRRSA